MGVKVSKILRPGVELPGLLGVLTIAPSESVFLSQTILVILHLNSGNPPRGGGGGGVIFDNAVVLLSTNKEVDERNMHMMERVDIPVTKIEVLYYSISREEGVKVDSNYCNNLEHVLYLSVGCRVIIQYLCILMIGYIN